MAINSIDEHVNSNGVVVYHKGDQGEGVAEAAITPGALVIKGTADGEITEAGALAANVLGYAVDNVTSASEDLLADFATGDIVGYYREAGDKFMGILTDAGTVTKGAELEAAAGGALQLKTTGKVVAVYIGEADVVAPSAERALVKFGGHA